jgi:hypothetical protein
MWCSSFKNIIGLISHILMIPSDGTSMTVHFLSPFRSSPNPVSGSWLRTSLGMTLLLHTPQLPAAHRGIWDRFNTNLQAIYIYENLFLQHRVALSYLGHTPFPNNTLTITPHFPQNAIAISFSAIARFPKAAIAQNIRGSAIFNQMILNRLTSG